MGALTTPERRHSEQQNTPALAPAPRSGGAVAAGGLPLAAGNQASARAAQTSRPGASNAGPGRGDAKLHMALEQARVQAESLAKQLPGAKAHHYTPESPLKSRGAAPVPASAAGSPERAPRTSAHGPAQGHTVGPLGVPEGTDLMAGLAPSLLGAALTGGQPEAGVVASGQISWRPSDGHMYLTGWLWGGFGFKTAAGWMGSYAYAEGKLDLGKFHLTSMNYEQPEEWKLHGDWGAGAVVAPPHRHANDHTKNEKRNQKGLKWAERWALTGFELAILVSPHLKDGRFGLEVIGLFDILNAVPCLKGAADFAEAFGNIFTQRITLEVGGDVGFLTEATRARSTNEGIFGWNIEAPHITFGAFGALTLNMSRDKGSLPGAH